MKYTPKKEVIDAILVTKNSVVQWDNAKEIDLVYCLTPFKDRLLAKRIKDWAGNDSYLYTLDGVEVPFQYYLVVIKGEISVMNKKEFRDIYIRMGDR